MAKTKRRTEEVTAAECGRRRWRGMTKKQRSEAARAAANARWQNTPKQVPEEPVEEIA